MDENSDTSITAQQDYLSKQLNELSQKIADLSNKQQSLHNSIQFLSSKFVECPSAASMDTDVPDHPITQGAGSPSNAYRNRRKGNIVVYNFPESANWNADIDSFKALSDTVFKLDLDVTKATQLGPKIPDKCRPLLLSVEDVDNKAYMLFHSHFLKRHEQYNRVYLDPDRIRLKCAKHKKVVEELKRRKAMVKPNW